LKWNVTDQYWRNDILFPCGGAYWPMCWRYLAYDNCRMLWPFIYYYYIFGEFRINPLDNVCCGGNVCVCVGMTSCLSIKHHYPIISIEILTQCPSWQWQLFGSNENEEMKYICNVSIGPGISAKKMKILLKWHCGYWK
jgi:hypothetical protein